MVLLLFLLGAVLIASLLNNLHRFTANDQQDSEVEIQKLIDTSPEFRTSIELLEKRRKQIKLSSSVVNYAIFLVFAWISAWFFQLESDLVNYKFYFFILLLLPILFLIKRPFFKLKNFTKDYKTQLMTLLIKSVDKQLGYEPGEVLPIETIEDSKMYNIEDFVSRTDQKTYKGEDLVFGTIDGVNLAFSDVEASYLTSNGVKTVFSGTYFVAEFETHFQGKTFVVPDFSKTGLFKEIVTSNKVSNKQSFHTDGEKIDLKNDEFEAVYDVFSTSEEANVKQLLNPAMLENMLMLDRKSNDKVLVAFSFIENNLYIGMLFNYLKFEPNLNVPITRLRELAVAYQQLVTLIELVNNVKTTLDQNTEIRAK